MAHVLVEWLRDGWVSVIPSSWVLSPHPLPDTLPVTGVSYWKKRSDRWDTIILAKSGE